MRVVHYLNRFRLEDGGVVRAVLDICALLAQNGHTIEILTWDASDVPEAWRRGDQSLPRVHELPRPALPGGFCRRTQIDACMAIACEADLLHLHTPWDPPNLQVSARARRAGLPYVLTVHGMLDDWSMEQKSLKKRLYLFVGAKRMLDYAAAVHCTAEAELTQVKRWFRGNHGVVVPLIFDLEPYRQLPGPDAAIGAFEAARTDDALILFLSRLHPKKSVEVLIDAAAILRSRGEQLRVLIAGSGDQAYQQSLRRRVDAAALNDHVFFLGLVTGKEKVSLFERADLFVLPTSQENFGFALVESLAAATPVVTTKGVDIWPEIEQSGGGVIIKRSPEAVADAIADLLRDADRRRSMGEAGRAWVLREFDGDTIVNRFESMYAAAAGKGRKATA